VPTIPPFDADGLLPPGDYAVTFDELRASILVSGPDDGQASWDAAWRLRLNDNLEILSRQLWQVGVHEIFADGSFAEDKDHPNDIDGYFECSRRGGHTEVIRRSSYRCGIGTGWNYIRIFRGSGSAAAFETSLAMSWSFLPLFGNRAVMANREAS